MTRESALKNFVVFAVISALMLSSSIVHVHSADSEKLVSVHINPDGSIDPADVPIQRTGDVYTFLGNIFATIVVDRDNVVIDGAGYTLQGTYNGTRTDSWEVGGGPDQELSNGTLWTMGIDMGAESKPENLTVKNLNIKNFYIGMYIWTSNNTLTNCAVNDNIVGILLSGDSNNITGNFIANNNEGIFFGVNTPGNEPLNIILTHNSFVDNHVQFSGCLCETYNLTEAVHTWDDGEKGNFWSDYNGTDTNGDGIGDTPYVIDILNQDRYPIIQSEMNPPTPVPEPSWLTSETGVYVLVLAVAVVVVAVVTAVVLRIRRHRQT